MKMHDEEKHKVVDLLTLEMNYRYVHETKKPKKFHKTSNLNFHHKKL